MTLHPLSEIRSCCEDIERLVFKIKDYHESNVASLRKGSSLTEGQQASLDEDSGKFGVACDTILFLVNQHIKP